MYLLDTDHITIIQSRTEPEFGHLMMAMMQYPPAAFHVSIVSFHEQVLGWHNYLQKAKSPEGFSRGYSMFESLIRDFSAMHVLPFDRAAIDRFDSLRAARVRIATMDLRIAATALERGFTVLTRNLVDFEQVPGLVVEDWTTP